MASMPRHRPLLHTGWLTAVLVAVGGLAFGACIVDTSIPTDAQLICSEAGQCPSGWTCDEEAQRCRPPDWAPVDAVGSGGDTGVADGSSRPPVGDAVSDAATAEWEPPAAAATAWGTS